MTTYIKAIFLVIVLAFLITFGVKNGHVVHVNYYFAFLDQDIPLYGLAYLSLVIGVLLGMVVGVASRYRLRRTVKDLERELKDLRKKVTGFVDEKGGRGSQPPDMIE
jgi:uncharacterized integral membrane protein